MQDRVVALSNYAGIDHEVRKIIGRWKEKGLRLHLDFFALHRPTLSSSSLSVLSKRDNQRVAYPYRDTISFHSNTQPPDTTKHSVCIYVSY